MGPGNEANALLQDLHVREPTLVSLLFYLLVVSKVATNADQCKLQTPVGKIGSNLATKRTGKLQTCGCLASFPGSPCTREDEFFVLACAGGSLRMWLVVAPAVVQLTDLKNLSFAIVSSDGVKPTPAARRSCGRSISFAILFLVHRSRFKYGLHSTVNYNEKSNNQLGLSRAHDCFFPSSAMKKQWCHLGLYNQVTALLLTRAWIIGWISWLVDWTKVVDYIFCMSTSREGQTYSIACKDAN